MLLALQQLVLSKTYYSWNSNFTGTE